MVASSRRAFHVGITPACALVTVLMMSSRSPPYSQILSDRFGAPNSRPPLASAPKEIIFNDLESVLATVKIEDWE